MDGGAGLATCTGAACGAASESMDGEDDESEEADEAAAGEEEEGGDEEPATTGGGGERGRAGDLGCIRHAKKTSASSGLSKTNKEKGSLPG